MKGLKAIQGKGLFKQVKGLLEYVGIKKKKEAIQEKKEEKKAVEYGEDKPHKGSKNKPFTCDSVDPQQCWCSQEREHKCDNHERLCWSKFCRHPRRCSTARSARAAPSRVEHAARLRASKRRCRHNPRITLIGPHAQLLEAAFRGTLLKRLDDGGEKKVLEHLLDRGANINVFDRSGITPLHYAARAGRKLDVKALLKHGADPMIADLNGNTPLHYAAMFAGSWKVKDPVKQLAGQTNGCKFCFGRHTVAKCPFLDCVKALAKKGKHALQCQDRHGNTPLRTLEAPGIEFLKMAKEREAESLNLPEAMEMIQAGREGVERLKLVAALL